MKVKLLVVLVSFLLPLFAWSQDEPSDRERKLEQLMDQIEQLESIVDSISEEIDIDFDFDDMDEDDKKFEWDNDRVKIDLSNGRESLTKGSVIISLGPTFLLDDEVSDAITPDFKPFRSWSGQLGFGFLTRFGHQSTVGLEYGLVYRFVELENRDDMVLAENTNNLFEYIENDVSLDESELYSNYLTVPVALRFNDKNNSKFSVSIGGFVGLRLNGKQELKYENNGSKIKSRERNEFGLPDFNYGVSFGIGGESVQLYSTYELSNFFDSEDVYKWNVLTTGVRFAF